MNKSVINPDTTLWYDEYAQNGLEVVIPPRDEWAAEAEWDYAETRALPVGNGRLGALVYGKTDEELILINESTVWSGCPHNYANSLDEPITSKNIDTALKEILCDDETLYTLPEVYDKACALVLQNKTELATMLIDRYFMGDERYQSSYQPFIELKMNFGHDFNKTENYIRTLRVDNALTTVDYDYGNIHYSRETLSSYPDQIIATNITSRDKTGNPIHKLSFSVSLTSIHTFTITKVSDNELSLRGRVCSAGGELINRLPDAIHFEARLVIDTDGKVSFENNALNVFAASYASVYITGATNYIDYKTVAGFVTDANGNTIMSSYDETAAYKLPHNRCNAIIKRMKGKSYAEIRNAHISDYTSLYNRSSIDFNSDLDNDNKYMPTDERIAAFDGYNDLSLEKLYFNYGKYLLISSSRSAYELCGEYGDNMLPKGQPSNLQGLWNWSSAPAWGSKLTANINVEMNYFMAQTANLGETEQPLFDALTELWKSGQITVRKHYGIDKAGAWVLHHNFDIWRGTAPVDMAQTGMWATGSAWLAHHLWEYYAFNNDTDFLKSIAYPVLKGAADFFEGYLKEYADSESGDIWLVSGASVSPEHGLLQLSPTMDNALIRNVFDKCIKAADILGINADETDKWNTIKDKIPPYKPAASGGFLREWLVDGVDEAIGDEQHRHPSHLWGLHPGFDVTPYDNDEDEQKLFDSFISALDRRGEGATGWSAAWRVCLWARAGSGEKAHSHLANLIQKATAPNMFDMHPKDIFQIDGNLGGAAGIIEMLVQSTSEDITLLPALPSLWHSGSVRGIKARGNHTVDICWRNGAAENAVIHAGKSGYITVRYLNGVENAVVIENGHIQKVSVSKNKQKITFYAEIGKEYIITGFDK